MVLRSQSAGSCVASGGTFGVSDFASAGTQTALEDGPLATVESRALVHHRLTSPFGAGWAISDVSRVYRDGDLAYLVAGGGEVENFAPRAHARSLATPLGKDILARDPHTGEMFTARDGGSIERVDPVTGALTPVLSGLAFNVPVHGLAVAYVGGSREFVVALLDRLLEIDAAGGQRVLTTRAAGAAFSQASVAAREDVVFYTDANVASLFRVRLSDPARVVEPMSRATGGDVRIYPQAALSGVTFADPRGLAFAADGTLYVADRGRNAVYAVSPDATGSVSAASHVEPVAGDGQGNYIPSSGERQPGVRFSLREPLGLSMTEDGLLFIATTYGIASFDPVAREAESLVLWGGIDELTLRPVVVRVSLVGLTASSAIVRSEAGGVASLVRFDIDRMSSERDATRTMQRLPSGNLVLTDTTRERVETFDVAGRLIQRSKRTGETILVVSYVDARGDAIDRITDAVGGETVFTYAAGKIQSITDARGRVTQLSVNGLGDLVSVTEPGNETHAFTYGEHRMTEKRSPRGDLTQFTYRADGTMQTATRPEGATTTVTAALSQPTVFNAAGKVEHHGSYTDARGVLHSLVLNAKGGVEQDTHVEDGVTRVDTVTYAPELLDVTGTNGELLVFDPASARRNRYLLVESRAVNGVQLGTAQKYDAHGRTIRETRSLSAGGNGASGDLGRWLYDPDGWLVESLTGPSSVAERLERDALGHVTRRFDRQITLGTATGRETLWTYRADGLPATMTDHGVTRSYTYAELPAALNTLGWTDTLGRSTTFTRDAAGNVTSTSDGVATTFADYDVRNRVTETRDALGNATTYGYTHAGCGCSQAELVTSIHTPDLPAGVDWTMTYDGDERLSAVTDPHGFIESYAYEPTGELKKLTDKLARDATWSHDQLGRVLAMVDTLGRTHASTYTVPAAGAWTGPSLVAGGVDAISPSTSLTGALRSGEYQIGHNAYQPAGASPSISLYRDSTFEIGYAHVFDSGNRVTNRKDRAGLGISSIAAGAAGTFSFEDTAYDVNSARPFARLLGTTDGSARLDHDFNFDVTATNGFWGGSQPETLEFFTRDAGGRPTELRRRFIVPGFTGGDISSTYTYWPDGRLKQLVNPDGTHDFTYDARGLMLTQVVSGEGTYSYGYDVMGRQRSITYPDGHVRTQLYDDLGRITSRCYSYSGPTERCYTAEYDAVGNPTRMADPDGVDVFTYDALDRLKKVTREVGGVEVAVEDYDYNALGALKLNAGVPLAHQRPRLDGAGLADAAVPASAGGQPVSLDAGGRVTSLRGTSFTWSAQGFVRQAQDPVPAAPELYGVDSNLRRISKTQSGSSEVYVFEGVDRIATLAPNGTVKEGYLFDGIDHPLRIKITATGTTAYYELDLAGNVRGLRASGGASIGGYRYSAFGQTLEDTSSITQPLRWKGRWFSPVAGGTYDVRARQWSPELGVFLTVDEFAWFSERTTLWGWPGMNPIRFDDLFGRGGDAPPGPGGGGGSCSQPPKPCDKGPVACHYKCDSDYLKAFQKCQGRGGSSTPQSVPSIPTPPKTRAECEAEAEEAQEQCNEKCTTDCRE
jgi:RHS repeat-associated protein